MGYKKLYSAIKLSTDMINMYVEEGMTAIDCTMGNGNDTVELARAVGENGRVIAFDIQLLAIENTSKALREENLNKRVDMILDGHENIDKHIGLEEADFIIYNLGYLPKGDKTITTKINTTIESLEKSLNILKSNGVLLIVAYPGHYSGMVEKNRLEYFLNDIDQKQFNVLKSEFINQANNPPVLYSIEKSKQ